MSVFSFPFEVVSKIRFQRRSFTKINDVRHTNFNQFFVTKTLHQNSNFWLKCAKTRLQQWQWKEEVWEEGKGRGREDNLAPQTKNHKRATGITAPSFLWLALIGQ